MTDVVTDTIIMETCCTCGMRFPMLKSFYDHVQRYRGGKDGRGSFWCPVGHPQHYSGESAESKARRLAEEVASLKQITETMRHQRDQAERKRKAEVTKRRKVEARVANGVCPCCNRTFADLARHMKSKHPEFAAQGEPA